MQKKISQDNVFQSWNSHTGSLLNGSKILTSFDKTALENCLFISKSLKRLVSPFFDSWFIFSSDSHSYGATLADLDCLKIPSYRTKICSRYSMIVNAMYVWNHSQSCYHNVRFHQMSTNKLKEILIILFLNRYD